MGWESGCQPLPEAVCECAMMKSCGPDSGDICMPGMDCDCGEAADIVISLLGVVDEGVEAEDDCAQTGSAEIAKTTAKSKNIMRIKNSAPVNQIG